jgi:hypothetical protein
MIPAAYKPKKNFMQVRSASQAPAIESLRS